MYPRQISDEQLQEVWNVAEQNDIFCNISRTVDENGDEFTIFGSWREVEAMAEIIYSTLPQSVIDDYAPSWSHLPEDRKPNPHHHIEWAIGDFGFEDEYAICSQCYSAINEHDYMPMHGHNLDLGEIYCRGCLETNRGDSAQAYLEYCANHLEDEGEILRTVVDPAQYGYIYLNPLQCYGEWRYGDFLLKYEGMPHFPLEDHADLPYALSYADITGIRRLGKAARLIDDNLRVIAQYGSYSTYMLWAKFETEVADDPAINLAILQYAVSRMFAKWRSINK